MQRILIASFAAWLLVVFGTAHSDAPKEAAAKKPADGIYQVHEKGDGPKLKRNDNGTTVVLGERLTENFRGVTMHSLANDNSRFYLHLEDAGPFPVKDALGTAAIVIDGQCFMVWSHSDRGPDNTRQISAVIHGEDVARAVANKLAIEANPRKHPGHKFHVTFEPDKKSYPPGEPIVLTMKIKNVGEKPACFFDGGRQRGPRDNQFGFIAMGGGGEGKPIPDTGDPTNFGGLGRYVTLKPGEIFKKTVNLDKWFAFKEPDTYRITGVYRLEFYESSEPKRRHINWEGFATGECSVRIEAAKD
jgi:hypothetical protein